MVHRLVERAVAGLMLAVFWTAFAFLAAGLGLWLAHHDLALAFLTAGLVGILGMPVLRLLDITAAAARERDWVTLAATLAVAGILFALTLRDAATSR